MEVTIHRAAFWVQVHDLPAGFFFLKSLGRYWVISLGSSLSMMRRCVFGFPSIHKDSGADRCEGDVEEVQEGEEVGV